MSKWIDINDQANPLVYGHEVLLMVELLEKDNTLQIVPGYCHQNVRRFEEGEDFFYVPGEHRMIDDRVEKVIAWRDVPDSIEELIG